MTAPFSAAERDRALENLGHTTFDLLVIGGGITGAGIARDAAMRGLRTALVERDDFASGTSSRSSRLVHGGIRYLEHGALHLVFEASRERRILLGIAPHLVRPLAFTWPVYTGARIPRWKLGAGLLAYDALALFRNVGRHHRLDADDVAAREPALLRSGLVGGATYFDASTDDIRLTLATIRAAAAAGATVVNHASVRALLRHASAPHPGAPATTEAPAANEATAADQTPVTGAIIEDSLDGGNMRVTARVTVNATGPWADTVQRLARPDHPTALRGSTGAHLAVQRERIGNAGALTLLSPSDGRVMFVLPSGPLTIIGTTETSDTASPDDVRASRADVAYLLDAANAFFPAAHLSERDVVSAWAGIRPLAATDETDPGRASREHRIEWTATGLLTVTGGKLTTYRAMAAETVELAATFLGVALPPTPTRTVPLPGGDIASLQTEIAAATAATGNSTTGAHLARSYGSEWRALWHTAVRDPSLAAPLAPPLPYLRAELAWAVRHEMALTLADLLVRRLHVAFETRDHGSHAARVAAPLVARLLGWSEERTRAELARYDAYVERIFGASSPAPSPRGSSGAPRSGAAGWPPAV